MFQNYRRRIVIASLAATLLLCGSTTALAGERPAGDGPGAAAGARTHKTQLLLNSHTVDQAAAIARAEARAKGYRIRLIDVNDSADLKRYEYYQQNNMAGMLEGYLGKRFPSQAARAMYDALPALPAEADQSPKANKILVVAEKDGEIVADVESYELPTLFSERYINGVGTDAAHRGQGLATAMLLTLFEEIGNAPTFLWTDPSNDNAISLYEQLGFEHSEGIGRPARDDEGIAPMRRAGNGESLRQYRARWEHYMRWVKKWAEDQGLKVGIPSRHAQAEEADAQADDGTGFVDPYQPEPKAAYKKAFGVLPD